MTPTTLAHRKTTAVNSARLNTVFCSIATQRPSSSGQATGFRSEMGQDVLFQVKAYLPRVQHSTTTETQYDLACLAFARNPTPPGPLLHWVCRDNIEFLDLSTDRLELNPVS